MEVEHETQLINLFMQTLAIETQVNIQLSTAGLLSSLLPDSLPRDLARMKEVVTKLRQDLEASLSLRTEDRYLLQWVVTVQGGRMSAGGLEEKVCQCRTFGDQFSSQIKMAADCPILVQSVPFRVTLYHHDVARESLAATAAINNCGTIAAAPLKSDACAGAGSGAKTEVEAEIKIECPYYEEAEMMIAEVSLKSELCDDDADGGDSEKLHGDSDSNGGDPTEGVVDNGDDVTSEIFTKKLGLSEKSPKNKREKCKTDIWRKEVVAISCKSCGKEFPDQAAVRGHLEDCGVTEQSKAVMSVHSHTRHEAGGDSKGEDYRCQLCGATFKTKAYLTMHKRTHVDDPRECDVCGGVLRNKDALRQHHKKVHMKRLIACDVCGKMVDRPQLKDHKLTHTDQRPFSCDVCGNCYKTEQSLKVHKVKHNEDKEFKCGVCERKVSSQSALIRHMQLVHEPKKCYECVVCARVFGFKTNLDRHLKKVHKQLKNVKNGLPEVEVKGKTPFL